MYIARKSLEQAVFLLINLILRKMTNLTKITLLADITNPIMFGGRNAELVIKISYYQKFIAKDAQIKQNKQIQIHSE